MAVEALKDITKEIHEIQLKNIKHKKNGYLTSTVGRYFLFLIRNKNIINIYKYFSSVLGTALIGGLLTANPVVSVGIFAGTVLTSVGSIIVFTKRDKDRLAELDTQVTGIMLGLEQEFERCHASIASLQHTNGDGDTDTGDSIHQLRDRLREASASRQVPGQGAGPRVNLDVITNVVQNMYNFSQGLRSR